MKPEWLTYDTKDDRREIHQALLRIHPETRLKWLQSLCNRVGRDGKRPKPAPSLVALTARAVKDTSAAEKQALEIYFDLWGLSVGWGLSLDSALNDLIRLAKLA